MKNLILIISVILSSVFFFSAHGSISGTQSPDGQVAQTTNTVNVYGNCKVCKNCIEGALKDVPEMLSSNWIEENKMLIVFYDAIKVFPDHNKEMVASVSYATDKRKATDAVYDNIVQCCKFERKKNEIT